MKPVEDAHSRYRGDETYIPDEARHVLEIYSGVSPTAVEQHVLTIREKGLAVCQYPCISLLRFLDRRLKEMPYFEKISQRLRNGAKFLDAGCGFGQEIRYLIADGGVPGEQLFGCDIDPRLLDLGYDLFRDRQHLRATLVQADLLKSLSEPVNADLIRLEGAMDIIFMGSFLHLFDWNTGLTAVKNLVEIGKSKPGTMLVGQQLGSDVAGERIMPEPFSNAYRHSTISIKQFFEQVGQETGTSWVVEAATSVNDAIIATRNKGKSDTP
jgi:SAM-dependent methyltransferase